MRRPILLLAVALVAFVPLTAACSSSEGSDPGTTTEQPTTPPGNGDGTGGIVGSWTLTSYLSGGSQVPAADPPATLTLLDDGTYSGSTGCNTTGGSWSGDVDGPTTFEPGPTTLIGCTDPAVAAQEAALTTGLAEVTDSVLVDDALTLQDASGAELFTFERGPAGIVGTYDVTGVNNGTGGVVSSAVTEAASLTFDAEGVVGGTSGCNSFSSTYEVTGDTIAVDDNIATTLMACEGEVGQFERQFLAALSKVATWERLGDQLTLRDAEGAIQLSLVVAP